VCYAHNAGIFHPFDTKGVGRGGGESIFQQECATAHISLYVQ